MPLAPEQLASSDRDGYLVIRGALSPDEVAAAREALDGTHATAARARSLGPAGSMHLLSAVTNCPDIAFLTDHPATFGCVWSVLGWNIHIYHSHLDVHPPLLAYPPFRFEWHQDGGRQNREIETIPRPRLSVKLAYWLSDVSRPGCGNLKVVPGSHLTNWIDGPPRRDIPWPDPDGAIEITAEPGDAVSFDRRIWHAAWTKPPGSWSRRCTTPQVAYDCLSLGNLDRAHTNAIIAWAEAGAAENALRAALNAGEDHAEGRRPEG